MRASVSTLLSIFMLLGAPVARAQSSAKRSLAPAPTAAPALPATAPSTDATPPPPLIAAATAVPTVLYPLRSLGIAPDAASSLDITLRNDVASLPEVRLISSEATLASFEREHDQDCLARLACAASAASRAGATQFVAGTVSELGDAVLVDLKLVDARSGQELRRVTHPIAGSRDLLIEILHAAAVELLAPARFVGRLDVKLVQTVGAGPSLPAPASEAAGAKLFVDGKFVATLPLAAPVEGISPGQRTVRVAKEGFRDATLFVEIRFDRTTEAYVDLPRGALAGVAYLRADQPPAAPAPPSATSLASVSTRAAEPRGPWLKIAGWSGLGLGAVSAVVGIALHVKAYQTAAGLNSREATNSLSAADVPLYSDVDTEVNAARGLYVAAGVLAAGGGAILIYDHHLDQQRMVIAPAPIVSPNGGGVGVSGAF